MIPNDQGGDKEARRNQGQISWDEIELSADWQVASELASRKCLAKISRKMWKTEINRNWKVKVMEGDREVAGSSTSLSKRPIPADARSYRRLTNTHQPVWVWPRELAVIRVFVETLWVKAMLVPCIGFFCWWSLSRQAIPLKVVSFAPCQLPSCWIWPRELKRKWKAGGKKTIEHFWPTLSVLSNTESKSPSLVPAPTECSAVSDPIHGPPASPCLSLKWGWPQLLRAPGLPTGLTDLLSSSCDKFI